MSKWEITAMQLINQACREAAKSQARALRAKQRKHALYGLEHRAVLRDASHVAAN